MNYMDISYMQVMSAIVGPVFVIIGLLFLFSSRFLNWMRSKWGYKDGKPDILSREGAYIYDRYGRGFSFLVIGCTLLWLFFSTLR